MAAQILGEVVRRLVAAGAVLLQGLHHDPVELAAEQRRAVAALASAALAAMRRERPAPAACRARCSGRGGSSSRIIRRISSSARASQLLGRTAWCRSAARRAARPASRCRCACRRRAAPSSACSGLMYSGRADALLSAGEERRARSAAARSPWRCRSRSPWARARRRACVTRTFEGFRSRWMIPFWCACCTAWQTCTNSSSRSRDRELVPRRSTR